MQFATNERGVKVRDVERRNHIVIAEKLKETALSLSIYPAYVSISWWNKIVHFIARKALLARTCPGLLHNRQAICKLR